MKVRASEQAIRKAREALARKGWKQTKLLEEAKSRNHKLSSQQLSCFFNGGVVQDSTAYKIGLLLDLTWEDRDLEPELGKKKQDHCTDIDELVREVRSRACEKIKSLHGTMRMLRVNHQVPVDDIYIDLNVLEQVSCDRTFSDWRTDFQPDLCSFDRLGLGRVLEEGLPALDMVQKYSKLMVFGKPGSGKTTFLKSLALQCIEPEGQLHWERKDYVPIFITLQKFAKDARRRAKFSLFDYIYHQEFCSWGEKNQQVVEAILEQGRALVLLDGSDEVQGLEYKPVIEEVESFCEYFHNNRFLITCRTQNQRYKFEGFTDVEVTDFKPEQVNRFIKRWFAVVADNAESEKLALELTGQLQQPENKQIAELAVTPVLLNLICSVFQGERGNLPKNRADLYKKGLRDLLEGLDESKGVQREPISEELTPEAKEDLLAYLAVTLFEANDYFPQQETLENLIIEHFQISRSKAIKVLKSIEEQSGLIVERSEGFWSFSHLTFQEYFTAKWFCDRADWEGLVSHILDKRWREVFLLTVGITESADDLVRLMKKQIDEMVNTEKLQNCLKWLKHKAYSISNKVPSKIAAIRAYYFSLSIAFDRAMALEDVVSFNLVFNDTLSQALVQHSAPELEIDRALELSLDRALDIASNPDFEITLKFANTRSLYLHFTHVLDSEANSDLKADLQKLKAQLPSPKDTGSFKLWWAKNSLSWIQELREIMKNRSIGHDWQLNRQEKKLLEQYSDANKLLVHCLNIYSKVSYQVRKEVEEKLLLPIADCC